MESQIVSGVHRRHVIIENDSSTLNDIEDEPTVSPGPSSPVQDAAMRSPRRRKLDGPRSSSSATESSADNNEDTVASALSSISA